MNNFDDTSNQNDPTTAKILAHECVMVTAWMFFAPIAIIFARYYRNHFPNMKFLNTDLWFNIHRGLMILVTLLSFIGLMLILSAFNWTWISSTDSIGFAHSLTGIIAISLSFIQVIIGFLRPGVDHKNRILFNIIHAVNGYLTFALASLVLDYAYLGNSAWGVLLGWSCWIVVLPFILEFVKFFYEPAKSKEDTESGDFRIIEENKWVGPMKTTFLILHVIITISLTLTLVGMIAV